ncbi:putative holin-like toxin [Anaerovorax odorimutans]
MVYYFQDYRLAVGHSRKGVIVMITYSELFQFGLLIVAIISLCLHNKK